ncbi:hypothetical protein ABVT39_007400 [Epinephelus coioides]
METRNKKKRKQVSTRSTNTTTASSEANAVKLTHDMTSVDASGSASMASDIAKVYRLLQEMSEKHDKKLDEIRATTASTEGKISELAERLTNVERRLGFLEDTDMAWKADPPATRSEVEVLRHKLIDLENHSRRNNLRITGFPEGSEGRDAAGFLAQALPEILGVEFIGGLEIERAHRAAGQPRPDGKPPRHLIVCFLRHTDKERIRNAALDKGKPAGIPLEEEEEAATRTKTSKVWEHFSLDMANKKITCKVCKADLAYHGSTSLMHEHLKRKHVGQLNETESDSPRPKKRATMDPLSWWRENEGRFPTLSNRARSLLCIPATSTPTERIFSAAGNICSQKRASLTRDHVDMLTLLSMNKLNDIA